jgi:hypothetical protein
MSDNMKLSAEEKELLRTVVRKRLPSLLWSVTAMEETPLKPSQRDTIKGLLLDEIRECGGPMSERGELLKKLIDRISSL